VSERTCWGVFRESAHSPGREFDDTEILRLTAKHLEAKGFMVTLKTPEEVMSDGASAPRFAFLMCESLPVLRTLATWDALGVRQVNSVQAILNTYRERMIALFEEANVPFVPSRVVATDQAPPETSEPVWLKRADVHNTQAGDVVWVPDPAGLRQSLAALAERGITRAVVQPHVDGDLVKFYGIGHARGRSGGPPWFRWFHPREERAVGYRFEPARMARLARQAATALGLEVYGGDAIVTPPGDLVLLDLNAWPSFALYRDEAARSIGSHLALRFGGASR
jgi:hypothetical protein